MALTMVRKPAGGAEGVALSGWQFCSRPTNLEPPGTVFRIDAAGGRIVVARLEPEMTRERDAGVAGMLSIDRPTPVLARLLALPGREPGAAAPRPHAVRFELVDPVRVSASDDALQRVLAPHLATLEFLPGHRYFVVRDVRAASAVRYHLDAEQVAELGGLATIVAAGLTAEPAALGGAIVTQAFPEPRGVLFRPEEIAPVRAGLAGESPLLGRVAVTTALDWTDPDYAVVRVFFGTDRNATGDPAPDRAFGGRRSDVRYGTCDVSIPRDHRMGEIEGPSIWKLEFREDPRKHVVLLRVEPGPRDDVFAALARRVAGSSQRSAFLFVHGYNVSFEGAAKRTAQIAYDLGFDGAAAFYSWPSQATLAGYTVDEQNVEWAQTNLAAFLKEFLERTGVERLFVIAHSMGNRALTRAVASVLRDHPALRPKVTEVILTAPDIDADVFRRDLAPALVQTGRPVTLYASSEDVALAASKQIHGYARAGDSGDGLVVVPGVETIDATAVDTSLIGHGYFAEARAVIADIFDLVRTGHRAPDRFGLREMQSPRGRYWAFKP